MLNSFDLFAQFYDKVKDSEDISEIIKEYGGANIYVPSYKATFRNDDILKEYKEGIKRNKNKTLLIRELASKHNLSYNTVSNIIKEPGLF